MLRQVTRSPDVTLAAIPSTYFVRHDTYFAVGMDIVNHMKTTPTNSLSCFVPYIHTMLTKIGYNYNVCSLLCIIPIYQLKRL